MPERSVAILLSVFMIFSTLRSAAIIRDKKDGTLQRYHFAYKSKSGYLFGYILYNFIITYCQVFISIGAVILIQISTEYTISVLFLLPLVIAIISVVFSTVICQAGKSEVQANVMASSLTALFSILGGTFVAVEAMPSLLRLLSFVSPIRWAVELVRLL